MDKITIFKKWIEKEYKTVWHTLSNSVLWEAVELYKNQTGIYI